MKEITHDKETDAVYIKFNDNNIFKTITIYPFINIDVDKNGETVGVEII